MVRQFSEKKCSICYEVLAQLEVSVPLCDTRTCGRRLCWGCAVSVTDDAHICHEQCCEAGQ